MSSSEAETSQLSDDTRSRILHAAGRCFATDGYARTRMVSVAAAAGVSRAALYKHFPSKSALLVAINQWALDEWRGRIQQSAVFAGSAADAIRNWLQYGLADRWRTHSVQILTAATEDGLPLVETDAVRQVIDDIHSLLVLVLRRGVETGELRAELDIEATAHSLHAIVLGLQRNHAAEKPLLAVTERREIDAVIDLILNGVTAPTPHFTK